jgi:hypothetical protein
LVYLTVPEIFSISNRVQCQRNPDVKAERVERAIAADVPWLAAHPTRTKKGAP